MNEKNMALKSGMRGMQHAAPPPAAEAEGDEGGVGAASPAEVIGQHVHGPDEQGHHHLNLTTLAAHLHSGKHPGK